MVNNTQKDISICDLGHPRAGLEQAYKGGGVKPVNGNPSQPS